MSTWGWDEHPDFVAPGIFSWMPEGKKILAEREQREREERARKDQEEYKLKDPFYRFEKLNTQMMRLKDSKERLQTEISRIDKEMNELMPNLEQAKKDSLTKLHGQIAVYS